MACDGPVMSIPSCRSSVSLAFLVVLVGTSSRGLVSAQDAPDPEPSWQIVEPSPDVPALGWTDTMLQSRDGERRWIEVEVAPTDTLEVVIDSRERGRIGGGVVLGSGLATAALGALGFELGATCSPSFGGGADCSRRIVGMVFAGGVGALAIVSGALLLDLDDQPAVLARSEGRTRRYSGEGRGGRLLPAILLALDGALAITGFGAVALQEPSVRDLGSHAPVLLPAALGLLATPFLLTLGADLAGGRGELVGALVGSLAGWVVGGLFGLFGLNIQAATLGIAAGIAGAAVGYEITHDHALDVDESGGTSDVSLTPLASASPEGASLGVAGTF